MDVLDAELEEVCARRGRRARVEQGEEARGEAWREEVVAGWKAQHGQYGRVRGGRGVNLPGGVAWRVGFAALLGGVGGGLWKVFGVLKGCGCWDQ